MLGQQKVMQSVERSWKHRAGQWLQ